MNASTQTEDAPVTRDALCRRLAATRAGGLACCPRFAEIADRWEAWWRFDADRPLLVGAIATDAAIRRDKAFDLLEKPAAWLDVRRRQLEQSHWIDQAIPNIRVDIGPVATSAFLGCNLTFAPQENTSWQDLFIEDWYRETVPEFDPGNRWFRMVMALAEQAADAAAERYLVTLPDLSGPIDVVANMRGTEQLLFDITENPAAILRAADRAVDGWEEAWLCLYDTITARGAGVMSWLMAWSDEPYTIPTCDFNFMLGPEQFRELCLPSYAEQARRAGRVLFHLDGPGASVHAPALGATPEITAVQYTPGSGTPSALAKLGMLQRLQADGKPIVVMCPAAEVPELASRLDRRGVVFCPEDVADLAQAESLLRLLDR